MAAAAALNNKLPFRIVRWDFSEPQSGKMVFFIIWVFAHADNHKPRNLLVVQF